MKVLNKKKSNYVIEINSDLIINKDNQLEFLRNVKNFIESNTKLIIDNDNLDSDPLDFTQFICHFGQLSGHVSVIVAKTKKGFKYNKSYTSFKVNKLYKQKYYSLKNKIIIN